MKTFFIYFSRLFVFPVVIFFTKQIEGKANIPQEDNFIIASNHINSLDWWFIGNALKKRLRTLRFVGAMDSFKTLLLSVLFYYAANTIAINRKKGGREKALKKIIKNLENKKSIVLFPEGNTNNKKELLRGKTGIAELALRTGVPVIPFGMRKAENSFKRIIEIGEPLCFSEEQKLSKRIRTMSRSVRQNLDPSLRSELENNQEEYYILLRKVTNKIMQEISKLSRKPYRYDN